MSRVPFIQFELIDNLNAVFECDGTICGIRVSLMARDTAITADVLGAEQDESRITSEDPRVHDHGHPGVAPGSGTSQVQEISSAASSETEPERGKPSEVIPEIAPEVGPSETEPEHEKPSEVLVEIAPERYEPSEVITEIAPERYEPSEVITEIAPERKEPSEVITEIAPERKEPSEVITEIAPERKEPSEVITEIAPERPEQE